MKTQIKVKPSNWKIYTSEINNERVFPRLGCLSNDFYIWNHPQTNFKEHDLLLAKMVGLTLKPEKGKIIGWLRRGTHIVMLDKYGIFWRRFCMPNSDKRYWINQAHGGKL
tara:strand:- start:12629 stop:12958 length:330 start_codon:yes stop_codon:yes gene_type:complete